MPRTALNVQIRSPSTTWTVPSGTYAIYNLLATQVRTGSSPATNIFWNAVIAGNQITWFPGSPKYRLGPFVSNAGDVVSILGFEAPPNAPSSSMYNPAVVGVCGWTFPTSAVKQPVTSLLVSNSATYTVPAGKYFIGQAYQMGAASPGGGGGGAPFSVVMVNNVEVGSGFIGGGGAFIIGPITAGAGDIISLGVPSGSSSALLNGFLHNV